MALDLESLAEAISGAIGALVSTTVLYPLDTCKTKYQAEVRAKHRLKYRKTADVFFGAVSTGKVLSLYQGLGAKLLQSAISQFVYFYGYSFFKRLYIKRTGSKIIGTKPNLLIGVAAGVCTVIITQPLDTASSRMQTSTFGKSAGLLHTLSQTKWRENFDGLGISLLLTSNPSIQYTVFDQLKRRQLQSGRNVTDSHSKSLSAISAFALGAISKCIATSVTYPAIRCKVMIQASENDETGDICRRKMSIFRAVGAIRREEGWTGFFKGLKAQILKTILSAALLLMIKEKITKSTWFILLAMKRYLLVKTT